MDDDTGVEPAPEIVDLHADANTVHKIGDFEGNAEAFGKYYIGQPALKTMRENDKAENARQIASQVDQQVAQRMAMQAAARPAPQPQPQPQGNGLQGRLDAHYAAVKDNHQGYVHIDQLKGILAEYAGVVNNEFSTRDRRNQELSQGLNKWHRESQQRAGTVDTLAASHAERVWEKEMGDLADEHPEWPRGLIEAIASGYTHAPGESDQQLREGIRSAISEHKQALGAHTEAARTAKKEKADQLARVGAFGSAAAAVPSSPGNKQMTTDEIAEHFWEEGSPAS